MLSTQFVHDKAIPAEYVPSKIGIGIEQSIKSISIFCDDIIDGREQEHEQVFILVFPKFLFPIQNCDSYGIMPTIISLFKKN